jgi:hypothetical protein
MESGADSSASRKFGGRQTTDQDEMVPRGPEMLAPTIVAEVLRSRDAYADDGEFSKPMRWKEVLQRLHSVRNSRLRTDSLCLQTTPYTT